MLNEDEIKPVVHKGFNCDGCAKKDIEGIRYKCSVCEDFDFCEECENTKEHPHSFLKIRNPGKAPLALFTVIQDEQNNIELNGVRVPPFFRGFIDRRQQFMNMLSGFSMGQPWGQQQMNQPRPRCPLFGNPFQRCRQLQAQQQ